MKKFLITLFTLFLCSLHLIAQQVQVTGKVTSVDDTPLIGVNVIEKGTTNGAVTNLTGNFTINVTSPDAVLTFSYLGFVTQEVTVGNQTILELTMEEDYLRLDEVVVTGYGVSRKSDLTAAISSVSTEALHPLVSITCSRVGWQELTSPLLTECRVPEFP